MKSFIVACIAVVLIAGGAALVLSHLQELWRRRPFRRAPFAFSGPGGARAGRNRSPASGRRQRFESRSAQRVDSLPMQRKYPRILRCR